MTSVDSDKQAKHRATYDNPAIMNDGQRLLIETRKSLQEIANVTGVSRAAVSRWRNGVSMPMMAQRIAMEGALAIPRDAWALPPHGKPQSRDDSAFDGERTGRDPYTGDDPAHPLPAPPPDDAPTIEHMRYNLTCIRYDLQYQKLTVTARSKLRSDEQRALIMIAKLEKDEELKQDRFVRNHPEWIRLRTAILKALERFPEAAKAVLAELDDME